MGLTIKFSKRFAKLQAAPFGKLLAVIDTKIEHLPLAFLEYDTDGGMYSRLPKQGDFLLLIFSKGSKRENLFTTLRRSTPEKRIYYRNQIGKEFDVVIEESENLFGGG